MARLPADARTPLQARIDALCASGRVRLDEEEAVALAQALEGVEGEIWLFGSRVEPERRGGDIDVLVLSEAPPFETSQRITTGFFARCEERIDAVVLDPARLDPAQADFLARLKRIRLS